MAIQLTDSAVQHVRNMLEQHKGSIGLRLGTRRSGCSGFAYIVDFAGAIEADDTDAVLRAWRESPVIKDAVDRLNADPEIREMFTSGRPFDQRSALSLLRNPTVNELLAEPQLVSQLWDLLSEIEASE